MERTAERGVVSGFFSQEKSATLAVQGLIDRHFDPQEDISIVLSRGRGGEVETREVDDKLEFVEGAKIGGGLGAILGGAGGGLLAAGVIAGPVGLVAAGPLLAVLQGALAGGAFGTFSGWLVSAGIVSEDAELEDVDLEEGSVWIGVHATGERREEALMVLREAGAERVTG
jgi:hypothetical protein